MSVNQDYIVENGIPVSPVVKMKLASGGTLNLLDFFYPVGTYYETSDSDFDPNTTWGGTWVQDSKGKVLVGRSDTGVFSSNNDTVGNESISILESNLPSHTHSYDKVDENTDDTKLTIAQLPSHNHTVEPHNHSLDPHTHTYEKSNSVTEEHILTVDEMPTHYHGDAVGWGDNDFSANVWVSRSFTEDYAATYTFFVDRSTERNRTNVNGNSQPHSHNITLTTTDTSSSSGTTQNSLEINSGKTGSGNGHNHPISTTSTNSGSTGDGNKLDIIQPSKVCIRWHRTA